MRRIVALPILLLLAGCLQGGPGGCSAEEAAAFNQIDHFEALVPEDDPFGVCGASFTTDADPQAVVSHYQALLAGAGWAVDEPIDGPMTDEDGKQVGSSIELTAAKGSMTFSLMAELFERDARHTYNVRVGLSGQ